MIKQKIYQYNLFNDLQFKKKCNIMNNIHPTAIIGNNTKIGDNVNIAEFVLIGNNVNIGIRNVRCLSIALFYYSTYIHCKHITISA